MKKSKVFWLFLVAMMVGMIDSLWLLWMHLDKSLQKGCSVHTLLNCSAINHPKYSQWFDLPVSFFALLVFIGIALGVYVWLKSDQASEKIKTQSFISLLIWASFAATLYFAGISIFIIQSFCIYCSIFYLSSLIMLLTWRSLKENHGMNVIACFNAALKSKLFIKWGLICVLLLTIGKTAIFKENHEISTNVQSIHIDDAVKLRTLGQHNAVITITKFSDFQCPACLQAGEILKTLVRQSNGTVKLIYKFFPLDPACNAKIPAGRGHLMACQAAKAAICAGHQGQFWSYHDLIFANQLKLNQGLILDLAQRLDLGMQDFKQCLSSQAVDTIVVQDIKEGERLKIAHTPTIFINGRQYKGSLTLSALQDALEEFE